MSDPRLSRALIDWIGARVPAVAGKVFPLGARPGTPAPFVTYAQISRVPVTYFGGLSGLTKRRVQVDVWDTDQERGADIAFKICGRKADPGLDQFSGAMAFGAITGFAAGSLAVQHIRASAEPEEFVDPTDGSETGWTRFGCDYFIHYIEG